MSGAGGSWRRRGGGEGVEVDNPGSATHLCRIAQESVNNTMKHGKARHVAIDLASENETILLFVRDGGIGLPEYWQDGKGVSLRSMRYRAAMIGATLRIGPNAGGGTIVACAAPRMA